jgi:hypothetical protein
LDGEILPEKGRINTRLIPNLEEVERRRERLEYDSAISSREWLREIEVMDQVIQLYPELKLLLCQVGNLSYQDVFYDPRVGINIIPKSFVLEAFSDEPLSLSETSPMDFGSNHRDGGNP